MKWIYLAQDKRMWWVLVNTQLNLLTRQNVENSLTSYEIRKFLVHKIRISNTAASNFTRNGE